MSLHRVLQRVALVVASASIALVIAECGLRVHEAGLGPDRETEGSETYDLDALGYNDDRIAARKPADEFRILSFGDSFTYSITPNTSSWNGVAQRRLAARTGRQIRIVNLGVRARSFPTYARQWSFWSDRIEHDAVLFDVYLGNDLSDLRAVRHVRQVLTPPPAEASPGLESTDLYLRTGTTLDWARWTRLRVVDRAVVGFLRWMHRAPATDGYLDTTQVPWEAYLRSMGAAVHPYRADAASRAETLDGWAAAVDLLEVADEIRARGKRVALLLSPPALFFQPETARSLAERGVEVADLDRDRPARLLEALARRTTDGVRILDLLPCLGSIPTKEAPYLGTNSHWSLEGNRVVGECVADAVATWWLDDDPRSFETTAVGPSPEPGAKERDSDAGRWEVDRILRDREMRDAMLATLRSLAGRVYADRADLEQALRDAGWRRDESRLRGSLDALVRAGQTPNAPPSEAAGWVVDLLRPETRSSVWILAEGRFVGFARTSGRRSDVAEALGLAPESADFVSFTVPLIVECDSIARVAELWAYGLTTDGRFRPLSLAGPARCVDGSRS